MGSSLILQGGAAVAKTLKESVTQTGHGFTVGDVIRWDGTQVPPKYVKAIADTAQNAEVAGVVSSTPDPNEFEVTYHGYIDLPSLAGISAPVMFLSGSAGGSLAASPPSAVGTVVKPVLTKNSNGSGYLVMNYLGTQIGGSSTIAVDEIQPVGTVMPYAGTVIPDTWLACNGGSYDMSSYPELYEKICYTSGERAPMYGHIVEIAPSSGTLALTEWTASAVGDYIYIKNRTTTAGGGTPDVNAEASYDFVGVIISKGTLASNPAAQGWGVRILGKYNSTNKRFEMPNAFVLSESGTGFASSVRVYSSVASGPRGNGGSINTATVVAFNTPNMRGRFLFGEVGSGEIIPDADAETLSTFAYDYPMASWGGEERHVITTAEIPSHTHSATVTVTDPGHTHGMTFDNNNQNGLNPNGGDGTNVSGASQVRSTTSNKTNISVSVSNSNTGSNTPHNNMPPYLAVRYIIKAKPYTRAAIIDGIDLPYNSLLVRDLRSRNVGGANGDLVLHTNTSGDSGNGTERMRINTSGLVGIGNTNPAYRLTVKGGEPYGSFAVVEPSTNATRIVLTVTSTGVSFGSTYFSTAVPIGFHIGNSEIARFDTSGRFGIGTASPSATLDVNGTLTVGDFGGATNVMVKPARVSGGGVGHVVPLFTWSSAFSGTLYEVMNHTTPLHAGTWLVYFAGNTDSGIESENFSCVMNHVWTVPASKWLTFATSTAFTGTGTGVAPSVASDSDSRVWYKIHDSLGTLRTASIAHGTITAANGWTSLNSNNAYTLGTQDATDTSKIGFVYSNKWYGPVNLMGYAIRIA